MPRFKPMLTLAAIASAALLAACGSSGLSATQYMRSVCNAVSPWVLDIKTRSGALNFSATSSLAERKRVTQGFLTALSADSDHALSRIKATRAPDIDNGRSVHNAVVNAFSQLSVAMRNAVTQASSLPTDNPSAFKAAAQALGNSVRSSITSINSSGLNSPQLVSAAAKEPACKNLSS